MEEIFGQLTSAPLNEIIPVLTVNLYVKSYEIILLFLVPQCLIRLHISWKD